VFPVRYELNSYILLRGNPVLKGLILRRKAEQTRQQVNVMCVTVTENPVSMIIEKRRFLQFLSRDRNPVSIQAASVWDAVTKWKHVTCKYTHRMLPDYISRFGNRLRKS
jgi:hypothetical protein